MKKEVDTLDATPSKRLFLSIIADYDINKAICELVDNGIDVWVRNGREKTVTIRVELNEKQQKISVQDDAGGLQKSDLRFVIGPGHTGSVDNGDETIGIFGVGTKRAVVALAQDVRIKTRFLKGKTHQIEFDENWIKVEDWELPVFEIDSIDENTTIIEMQSLRVTVNEEVIQLVKDHLKATYAKFLKQQSLILIVNDVKLSPVFFENWAYPPRYGPRMYYGILRIETNELRVTAVAGLSRESSPATGEYGVYFYCNDRLVVRALKSYEVGFTKGLAGAPHPKVSLTRVIVSLNGNPRVMPWNSSKSDINTKHESFIALRNWLVQVVKDYASLSRIWMGDWPGKVFKYTEGAIERIEVVDFPDIRKSFLPPLPHSRPRFGEKIGQLNKTLSKKKPWTTGLLEGIIVADMISHQKLEQRGRITLIILDSTLEIGFKEFLVHESGKSYSDSALLALFQNRSLVEAEVKKYVSVKADVWKKVKYYYGLRCKFIHERATVGVSEEQLNDFREVVEFVLTKLFKLKFKPH